ncbi:MULTISPECIES: hypothetical protein [unclassified Sphingomonas]|uniref:hypothetical protein n=1 Tax=unclassified Sphingomonas TaxID=196159 RepID=UPI001ACBB589|nr:MULTISPECIES: hypothetical protein [unclassified Sphingomonas]MBN8847557.1 hypothetical protein [Sphingomonas sp.]MBS0283169.1 hypothetical protein [Pseudomonadota bacterium]
MKKIVLLGAFALGMLTAGTASAADYPPCSASVRDNCVQGARSATHVRHARHHVAKKHHVVKKHHAKRAHHAKHRRAHHVRHHKGK